MYVVSVKVESHVIEMLDSYAKKHGLNRSVIIRRAIEKFYKKGRNKNLTSRIDCK